MMSLDELRQRLDDLAARLETIDARVTSLLDSVGVLQRNSLKLLGAGSLLGGCVIYVLARAAGLG